MARPKRIWSPNHFHHVVSRGNWRADLFQEDHDFVSFMNLLHYFHRKTGLELASYCLMSNHFHLLLRTQKTPLPGVMRNLNKAYADYFNKRYGVQGHVFEKRYFSKPIYDAYGLLEVSRYIHLNPVEASIVDHPLDYRWSSFPYFESSRRNLPDYMNISEVYNLFTGKTDAQKKTAYCTWLMKKYKESLV
ncbi:MULTISPECIES: transposase [Bacillus]|uniref:transposase n=1 Tax=Bacillus TaxID=1386 RepID=UPI0028812498|nr:transposase [Bacillus sp. AG4(2022)]MDT0161563.1 transposase [Bacillus sp. AG4(2022)]